MLGIAAQFRRIGKVSGYPGKALSETAFCVPNSNLHARAPPCPEVIAVCFHANVAERACVRGGGCPTRTTWVIIHPARALVVPAGQTKRTGCGVDHITRVKYRNDLVSLVRRFLPQNLTARPTCACKKKREGRNAQRFPHPKWVHAGARTLWPWRNLVLVVRVQEFISTSLRPYRRRTRRR